jgi:hypothetical protein
MIALARAHTGRAFAPPDSQYGVVVRRVAVHASWVRRKKTRSHSICLVVLRVFVQYLAECSGMMGSYVEAQEDDGLMTLL